MKRLHSTITSVALLMSALSSSSLWAATQFTGDFRLESNNGAQWNEVVEIPSALSFDFDRTQYSPSGNTNWSWSEGTQITLRKGDCRNTACTAANHPVVYTSNSLSQAPHVTGNLSPAMMMGLNSGMGALFSQTALKASCNAGLGANPDLIYEGRAQTEKATFTLHVVGDRTTSGPAIGNPITEGVNDKRLLQVPAKILCESIGPNPGPLNATELKVFLSTQENATTQPSPGVSCPKVKVTTRLKSNRAGTIEVETAERFGLAPTAKKTHTIQTSMQADGSFMGRSEHWVSVNQSSVLNVQAQELDNPYVLNDTNLSTPWKKLSVVCGGHSGMGLSGANTGSENPGKTPSADLVLTPGIDLEPKRPKVGGAARLESDGQDNEQLQVNLKNTFVKSYGTGGSADAPPANSQNNQLSAAQRAEERRVLLRLKNAGVIRDEKQQGRMTTDADWNESKAPQRHAIPLENATISGVKQEQLGQQRAEQRTKKRPVLYQGKIGDRCQPKTFPKRALIKTKNKQRVVECVRGKVTENKKAKIKRAWRKGDPVFLDPGAKKGPKPQFKSTPFSDEMPDDLPAG